MPDTLTIPSSGPTVPPLMESDIETILDRMEKRESGGNAKAVGKAGERGLFQIKPSTAAKYGVTNPDLLFNPQVNRYVARRYLTDLVSQFGGDIHKAVAAYNAGPGNVAKGNIPESTKRYVAFVTQPGSKDSGQSQFSIGSLFGEGTANAAEDYTGPVLSVKPPTAKSKDDYSGAVLPAKPAALPTPSAPLPLPVRAAGWLPMAGQLVGEAGGAIAGAAIPGLGETGVPEYAGAVSGGAGGSALGAEGENWIRKKYGLPPVSVGQEALFGGAGSAVGGLLQPIARYRKAAALAKATGISFDKALEQIKNIEAGLEGTVGMGARKAKLLENAPAASAQGAYNATRAKGLQELGDQYDSIIGKDAHKLTPGNAINTLQGSAGKMLDLTGKALRQAVEDEFKAQPMTVTRVQKLISIIRAQQRMLNPETQAAASRAYGDIIKALQADRDAVIGPTKAAAVKVVDQYYARQIARFPLKTVRKAFTEPQAAEAILAHKPGEVGRTLEVIREMQRMGHLAELQRATAARLYQGAKVAESANPIGRMDRLVTAVKKIDPEVFDELYGMGAQKRWLETANTLTKAQRDLLANPDRAAAIKDAVRGYLREPGMAVKMSKYMGHRLLFDAVVFGGGFETGHMVTSGIAILYMEAMEAATHSKLGMRLLEQAALSKDPQIAAKLLISSINTSIRGGAEHALGSNPDAK